MSMQRTGMRYGGFLLLVGFLAACTGCEAEPVPPPVVQPSLVIGVLPEQDIFKQLRRYEPLAQYLSRKTGAQIDLKVLPRYGNIIENFTAGHLDGAFFGSFTYVLAREKLGVEVLVRPENFEGVSTYHGHLIVRKDSGIRGPQDMRGKVFAFVDKATTAGYLFPLAYFKKNGIEDYRTYFGEYYFAGTHQDVALDVFSGKADVGALKDTVYSRMVREDSKIGEQLLILESSPVVPENALAVRSDLAPGLKAGLKSALLGIDRDPEGAEILKEFGSRRFIETTDRDYAAVVDYAGTIGLDLSVYDYRND